jgi:uncharacterized protein YjiS (DUF1127 family)
MALSIQSHVHDLSALSARPTLAPAVRFAVKVAFVLMTWDETYRTRRTLKRLTPDQLDDIGVSRSQAMKEAKRPFWKR